MIASVGSTDAPGLATSLMNKKTAEEQLAVEVVKKGQDIEKQKGQAAVQMIKDAAPTPAPGRIDTFA